MGTHTLTIAIAYVAIGGLLAALAIPLILGKVPPNMWYGFRIRLTLDNADIWYPVNAWAGRRLLVIGLASAVLGLVGLLVPSRLLSSYFLALAVLLIVSALLVLVLGVRYARSLAGR